MNNSFARLIDGMCATLRAEVLTRLDDEFGRGQVFGVINLLNTFKVRANWSAEFLLEQIESQRGALEAAYACLRQGAPALTPPASPSLAQARHAPIAELMARRDSLNAAISALLVKPGTLAYAHEDGFVLARVAGNEAEILTLAVAPAARGRGLGRALLQAVITKAAAMGANNMFLEVGVDNPAAMSLYAGLGFSTVGTRKAYYNGRDALVLRLSLPAKFA